MSYWIYLQNKMKTITLILGDMLFEDIESLHITQDSIVFMAEDASLATHFQYHKQKILFFFTAMREYAQFLQNHCQVLYYTYQTKKTYEELLLKVIRKEHITRIQTYDISDHFFKKRIIFFCTKYDIDLVFLHNPSFLTTMNDFDDCFRGKKKYFHNDFYIYQRKRLQILLDEKKNPLGGKWSFDKENRKKISKNMQIDNRVKSYESSIMTDVKKLISKHFSHHFGDMTQCIWPTTHSQAKSWFNDFLDKYFSSFGPYEDAIDTRDVFLFHSGISPLLNTGLLTPTFVLDSLLEYYKNNPETLQSVEGFIRQIIGWREFMKCVYDKKVCESKNELSHTKRLAQCWYTAQTGIVPVDDVITKVKKYGYAHHIERLMIIGNVMLLCQIHPDDVYKWFMECFIDSADWVMVANVYGMSQFADGGVFATKPYICSSNYILKMSSYKKDTWCDELDALYWHFISEKRSLFIQNPRLAFQVKMLDKMKPQRKEFLEKTYQKVITRLTKTL